MPDPRTIFEDRKLWRYCHPVGVHPHAACIANDNGNKCVALISKLTRAGGDWPVNQAALQYVTTAVSEQRLAAAWVVLIDQNYTVIEAATVGEVVERIGTDPPMQGPHGPFWWINREFKPANSYRGAADDGEF